MQRVPWCEQLFSPRSLTRGFSRSIKDILLLQILDLYIALTCNYMVKGEIFVGDRVHASYMLSGAILVLLSLTLLATPVLGEAFTARTVQGSLFKHMVIGSQVHDSILRSSNSPYAFIGGPDIRPGMSTKGFWSWQDDLNPVPLVEPLKIPVFVNALSNNISDPSYPPISNYATIELPSGEFSKIAVRVDVRMESVVPGRVAVNYDRPLWIFVEKVPLLIGTTAQRFNWTVTFDVTHLYPLLVGGKRTFELRVPNWIVLRLGLTGYFVVNVTLLYYPGPKPPNAPDLIVPLWTWTTINKQNPYAVVNASIPENAVRALLYIFTEGASYDEFWWSNIPTDRLILVYSDSKLIAVSQPFPYIYTGGILPILWRPVPAIGTYAFDPLVVDVTPYIPFITGSRTFNITIANLENYWLIGGFLALKLSSTPITYEFLGDNPQLARLERTQATDQGEAYVVQVTYSNVAAVRITNGTSSYVYSVQYALAFTGLQQYSEEWWNSTILQYWSYTSTSPDYVETRASTSTLSVIYGELLTVYGDVSKATIQNPVPAEGLIKTAVYQRYLVDHSYKVGEEQVRYYHVDQAVSSTGYMKLSLIFISPTGAIITGVADAYARTLKTTSSSYEEDRELLYYLNRLTIGATKYPPLTYLVLRDYLWVNSKLK